MTQIKLNKSSLSMEQKNLRNYKQFLPSLDLKRRKLLVERNKAHNEFAQIKQQIDQAYQQLGDKFPMLANSEIDMTNLLSIEVVETANENIVGVNLPTFNKIQFKVIDYTFFNSPHWLDNFIYELKKIIELRIRLQIAEQRTHLLDKSLQTVTQRKNLFEKVLIPKTITVIRTIQIFLADNERAAVVRSKIAKKKRQVT